MNSSHSITKVYSVEFCYCSVSLTVCPSLKATRKQAPDPWNIRRRTQPPFSHPLEILFDNTISLASIALKREVSSVPCRACEFRGSIRGRKKGAPTNGAVQNAKHR
ncbi:hypothetical protein CDAR_67201 [Caerostris darwini]|uniref:Uncharacterized protein n=1 Tax=Caerostris darwini TaxID=1538125 RepID=A0AAV4TZQ8_9ARAC|nr:hypothetical protein CDAR_67201 [Caerostris darwini]